MVRFFGQTVIEIAKPDSTVTLGACVRRGLMKSTKCKEQPFSSIAIHLYSAER